MEDINHKLQKLKITAICVTKNNGELLKYSILSIVNYIDEILIYDDSLYNDNFHLIDLQNQYKNITVVRKEFDNDLGIKKQYLNENARNDIILRWDNDFILYDYNVLYRIYILLKENKIDGAYNLSNLNIKFAIDKLDYAMYCKELYIFRKGIVKFGRYEKYPDYPILLNKLSTLKNCNKEILFLHMSNFKSYEEIYQRIKMCEFITSNYDNYYRYMYNLEHNKDTNNYFDIINYKKKQLDIRDNMIYKYHDNWDTQWDMYEEISKIKDSDLNFDISKLDKYFLNYIETNFKHIKINENPLQYKFLCNQTDTLTNIFYYYSPNPNKIGNFGDLLTRYIFEKLTGYTHKFIDIRQNKDEYNYVAVGSIINLVNDKSIVWGSGIIEKSLQKINPYKIHCVRGPRTREALKNININVSEKYGDPALLLPLIYNTKPIKKYKIGMIPHACDYNDICNLFKNNNNIHIINLIISNTDEKIQEIIDEICSCEFIFSSSLHGVIVSNCYNIPVIRFKLNKLGGDDIKFIDYFESIYSNKYLCQTTIHITNLINDFNIHKNMYKSPDLIKIRQIDLVETCPFIDKSLKPYLLRIINI
jgi:pyruvyltransferase